MATEITARRPGQSIAAEEIARLHARVVLRRRIQRGLFFALLIASVGVSVFPFYWMVVTSLKSWAGIFTYPPTFLPEDYAASSYREVFETTRLWLWLVNSAKVTIPTTALSLALAATGAYALSRFKYRGKDAYGFLILVTQMLPGTLLLIPIYLIFKNANLLDNHVGLVIAYTTFSLPFCLWMQKGYFDTIPVELEEAALVDGCSRLEALVRIVLPLSLPGLAVTAMFAFVLGWNEFVFAATLLSTPELATNPVGLASFVSEYGTPWASIMAASAVSSLPVLLLFLFLQRYLLYGLTAGAVKG